MLPENNFDAMLKKNLKNHKEYIRGDFADELLTRIELFQKQKALRKVILQERALAAVRFLILAGSLICIFFFHELVAKPGQILVNSYPLLLFALKAVIHNWKIFSIYIFTFLICLYGLYESFIAEN